MTGKYVDGLPLYRQEKKPFPIGHLRFPARPMANWMIKSSELWLEPLYDRLHEFLLKRDILHSDETTLQVLREEDREATSKSYMWLYRTGREEPAIVLYDYQTTRANKHPLRFLSGFKGYLHVDGYAGYNGLPDITLVGCWAHARRQFDEALKALPKDKQDADVAARHGLEFCNAFLPWRES